jgi:hypothetical protein
VNGEKGAFVDDFANFSIANKVRVLRSASFSPFTGRNARQGNEGQRQPFQLN